MALEVVGSVCGSGELTVTLDLSSLIAGGANGFLLGGIGRDGAEEPTGFTTYPTGPANFEALSEMGGTEFVSWYGAVGVGSAPAFTFPSTTTMTGYSRVMLFAVGLKDATLWTENSVSDVYGWYTSNGDVWNSVSLYTGEPNARPHVIIDAGFFADYYGDWSGYGGADQFPLLDITPDSPLTSLCAVDEHGITLHGAAFGDPFESGYATDALAVAYTLNETITGGVTPGHTMHIPNTYSPDPSYQGWGLVSGLFYETAAAADRGWSVGMVALA